MQKQLTFTKIIKTENGFLFPYVCFIAALVLLSVVTSITLYANDTKMTTLQMEQIELETLHQMAYQTFISERNKNNLSPEKEVIQYDFPNGIVKVTYYVLENDILQCTFEAISLLGNKKISEYILKE